VVQEVKYGVTAARAVGAARPDVVVLSNIPLISLSLLTVWLRMRRIPYVFWHQDIYSHAIAIVARRRLGPLGGFVGWVADRAERMVARGAAAIVPISTTFIDQLHAWGVQRSKVTVVPNWGAIDEMPVRSRDNTWGRAHGLADVPVVMYAGTLGLKHDPAILTRLAKSLPDRCRFVVVSQGQGREWLEAEASDVGMMLLDYQPYEQLPDMLASADVLVVALERDASRYSVPSKVLNYLCAGRPVLALLPRDNAVARMIESAEAGLVADPVDVDATSAALNSLLADQSMRERMGVAARQYAETTFDVESIGDVFESVTTAAYDRRSSLPGQLGS
jgi:colanic acid biosynthesis glycosyl transferase WcaI